MLPAETTDSPELRLWLSALLLYVYDVHRAKQIGPSNCEPYVASAYYDFYSSQHQLKRLCEYTGYDAQFCASKIKQYIKQPPVRDNTFALSK